METVTVIKPNLSTPPSASGGLGVSVEDCPSMADTAPGGKLYREPDNQSSEERDQARKKVKAKADSARTKWSGEKADISGIVESGPFGGVEPDGTTAPLSPLPTSPAEVADDAMAGDKTADAATTVPG